MTTSGAVIDEWGDPRCAWCAEPLNTPDDECCPRGHPTNDEWLQTMNLEIDDDD